MLDLVGRYALKWRFRFNGSKSKIMMIGRGALISGNELKCVDSLV